jgi:CRP-like cAMP-binding protein
MSEFLSLFQPQQPPPVLDPGLPGLGGNRLLEALPPGDFELLAPSLHKARFEPGDVLQEAEQPITRACFLENGLVSLRAVLPDGNSVDAHLIGREGAVGLMAGLVGRNASTRAVVLVTVSALQISIPRLADAAARSKPVRDMIVRYNDDLFAQAQTIAACNSVHHVEQRLCRWLLQAHERCGDSRLPVTQRGLADCLGVQRTTVTMIGRRLQAEGVIKARRGQLQILDVKALERRACGCWRRRTCG